MNINVQPSMLQRPWPWSKFLSWNNKTKRQTKEQVSITLWCREYGVQKHMWRMTVQCLTHLKLFKSFSKGLSNSKVCQALRSNSQVQKFLYWWKVQSHKEKNIQSMNGLRTWHACKPQYQMTDAPHIWRQLGHKNNAKSAVIIYG